MILNLAINGFGREERGGDFLRVCLKNKEFMSMII